MNAPRLTLALVALACVFAGVWFAMLDDDDSVPMNTATEDEAVGDNASVAIAKPELAPPDVDENRLYKPDTNDPETVPEIDDSVEFHTPDYGPLLRRGNGVVSFELYDANNQRVKLGNQSASVKRILGNFAITEGCRIDSRANQIICDGLATDGKSHVGLEPGEYELTFNSGHWGNQRTRIHVNRGEARTERLQSKHFKRTVCFYFVDQHGQPIRWVNGYPTVSCKSDPLSAVRYGAPDTEFLKTPPDEEFKRMGMGWSSSRRFSSRHRANKRYETDEGRFYFTVWAGATNTVTFKFDESIWGTKQITVTDTFVDSRWESHQVTINLPDDHLERAEELKIYKLKSPGNRPSVSAALNKPPKPEFLPETSPIKPGYARVIATIHGPDDLRPKVFLKFPKYTRLYDFKRANNQWYYDARVHVNTQVRAQGNGYQSAWQDVALLDGQITYTNIVASPTEIEFTTDGLPPTLNAAANLVELQLSAPIKVDPDGPRGEPPHPNRGLGAAGSQWNRPEAGSRFLTRYSFARDGENFRLSSYINPDTPFEGQEIEMFKFRAVMRTVAKPRPRSGGSMRGPDGRYSFTPIFITSGWQSIDGDMGKLLEMLKGGEVTPRIDELLTFRAVGEKEEGLPWTHGVLLPMHEDKLAQTVRAKMQEAPDGTVPNLDNHDPLTYADDLNGLIEVEDGKEQEALKKLIGEKNYNAFDTHEQRKWFAENGSWYNPRSKVFTDEHGYVLTRQHKLEAGGAYVLYLWSNSRDQMKPDKRIVFKAGENNTDLGVIRLPSYR
ncbi:MAG: hypothetical protein ACYTDT_01705 [Planctomycetota bacterium]|jgi:hypothetical protein